MQALVDKLYKQHILTADEFHLLLAHYQDAKLCEFLFSCARAVSNMHFGNKIYIRGLIEISNYCQNNCYYCGIRAGNRHVQRYRLSKEEILSCCRQGYALGFRTFVLQGGEDPYYTDDTLCEIVSAIKAMYSDCAVTLSLGERTRESYQRLYESGADRYLLRHETADPLHYSRLHPKNLSLTKRISCLFDLKEIGYQTGTGFPIPDKCHAHTGFTVYSKTVAPNGRDWAVHPTHANAFCKQAAGQRAALSFFDCPFAFDVAKRPASGNHSAWYGREKRKMQRNFGRRKRCDAKLIPHISPRAI